jgi:lipopolysaccharide assembly outer membrane protein LptD (OstA)
LAGLPVFKDGDQEFTATKLRYNFRSKKGIIYEARTKQEDLYVLGQKAKFVAQTTARDSVVQTQNTVYNQNALLTTCDDPHPHFGIRTRKLKVIPDKLVVTGFSNVEIGGIPTPLVLPFGFYPITKTRKSGLIIPRDFEFADREGLGIKDWGYYFPFRTTWT